jgi:hypothetical protein
MNSVRRYLCYCRYLLSIINKNNIYYQYKAYLFAKILSFIVFHDTTIKNFPLQKDGPYESGSLCAAC